MKCWMHYYFPSLFLIPSFPYLLGLCCRQYVWTTVASRGYHYKVLVTKKWSMLLSNCPCFDVGFESFTIKMALFIDKLKFSGMNPKEYKYFWILWSKFVHKAKMTDRTGRMSKRNEQYLLLIIIRVKTMDESVTVQCVILRNS